MRNILSILKKQAGAASLSVMLFSLAAMSAVSVAPAAEQQASRFVAQQKHLAQAVLGHAEIENLPPEGSAKNAIHAASLVHDTIVAPGTVFSFNEVVGPRTLSRGFVEGLSVMRTKNGLRFVPDVGGGICRVSTAIHQAVLKAGLKVIERHPHSLPVAYATPGMDAAVSWGAWDYRFQNTTHYPIKLAATADENKISVRILALPHTNPVE